MCLMRARRFLRPQVVRRRTPARRGVSLNYRSGARCDVPTAFWERPEVAALVRRAPRESVCCPAARYSSASGAWQGARMDGAALAFLGATSAFLLPGTVPLMGINLQNADREKPVSIAEQAKNSADGYRALKAPL